MSRRTLFRLLLGILTVVFLPLGLAFLCVGALVDQPSSGRPAQFLVVGAIAFAAGVLLALGYVLLSRSETAERRRRRAGLRAPATVVRLQWNPQVRSGARISVRLTVRFPAAPTPDGTATRVMLLAPGRLVEGEEIPVLYDPADPANFEPVIAAP